MALQRIRIVEMTTTHGSAAFSIEADTAELAAAQVLAAYRRAIADGHTSISLPDGQNTLIEPNETIEIAIRIEEVDADEVLVREIDQTVLQRGMN